MTNYFLNKNPSFICCENIFAISPANANRKQNFQKKTTESSRGMEEKVIIEIKKSINPFMTESDMKKEGGRPFKLQPEGGEKGLPRLIVLTSGLDSALGKTPRMSKGSKKH